jgi:hypothetical protein
MRYLRAPGWAGRNGIDVAISIGVAGLEVKVIIRGMGASLIVTAVESDKAIKTEGDEVSGATSSP